MNKMSLLALGLLLPTLLNAQNFAELEKRVTEFTLANGMTFIVYERHQAPVVSFFSRVNVGSADDPKGASGLAHMFEHMAFKGTNTIGTVNFAEEQKAMNAVETAYDLLSAERNKGGLATAAKVTELETGLKKAIDKANGFVDKERFTKILEENGAAGLNAFTSLDETAYIMSMPANKVELWFALESDRFLNPVFREFYNERGVIREEYRQRVESDPQGKLIYEMLTVAFSTNPYRTHPAGIPSDIESYRLSDALEFRKTYYVPSNIIIGIAGDVDPKDVKLMAEKYFGKMKGGPKPTGIMTKENPQQGEKRLVVETASQPIVAIGYKRPNVLDPDDTVLDVLAAVLGTGRTSLLNKEIVEDKKIALAAIAQSGFPGNRRENLFLFFAVPNAGKTTEDCEKAIYEIIERVKKDPVSEAELKRVKTILRAGIIRGLDSNTGMAQNLVTNKALFGDWRMLFQQIDALDKITAADVRKAANKYLDQKSRTVASLVQPKSATPNPAPAN